MRAWLVYLGAVAVGGALLAPALYGLTAVAAEHFPVFEKVRQNPFHRFVTRSLMLTALAGLWPLVHYFGFRSWRDVGWVGLTGQWGRLGAGLALGVGSLAPLAACVVAFRVRQPLLAYTLTEYASHLLNAGLAAVLVALAEETLFRGAVFGALRKVCPLAIALMVSATSYALVHFFAPARWVGPVEWTSGFQVLGQMCRGFLEWKMLVPGFLNLTLAGVLLALAYQRSGNLYLSIGIHAGWVLWLKSYGFLTQQVGEVNLWFWGTAKLVDGWLATACLGVLLWVLSRCRLAQCATPK
jgi:hypothetical protein